MCVKMSWLFGALILGGMALGAQEIKPAIPGDFGATVNVRIVNVEVDATDSKGHPVHGLTAADFEMTVDKHKVPIEYFTEVAGGEEVASGPDAVSSPAPVKVGTSYLIFVDNAFSGGQRNRVLSHLENDLRLGPEDRVAIVVYDGRPNLLSGWTGDIHRVREILDRLQRNPPACFASSSVRSEQVAASVAMRGLPTLPGRKLFLLVSGGWPQLTAHSEIAPGDLSPFISQVPLDKLYEPVADTANLLGYTIYFLEVPGTGGRNVYFGPAWQTRPWGYFSLVDQPDNLSPYDNLWKLARRTGGTVVGYSPKSSVFEQMEQESHTYYSLAFSPDWQTDGKRHHVEVKVHKPHIRVQSRDGYFDMTPKMQNMIKAESMLLFGRGSTIQALAGKSKWAGFGAINLPVTLGVPARMLKARPVAGGYEMKVTVFSSSQDDWGLRGDHPETPLVLTLPQAPLPEDVIPFTVTLNLNTLGQQMAFVVLDEAGGGVARAALDYHHKEPKQKEPKKG
jgi:VWFA-related protein